MTAVWAPADTFLKKRNESYGSEIYENESYNNESYENESYGNESYGNKSYGNKSYGNESYNNESYRTRAWLPSFSNIVFLKISPSKKKKKKKKKAITRHHSLHVVRAVHVDENAHQDERNGADDAGESHAGKFADECHADADDDDENDEQDGPEDPEVVVHYIDVLGEVPKYGHPRRYVGLHREAMGQQLALHSLSKKIIPKK